MYQPTDFGLLVRSDNGCLKYCANFHKSLHWTELRKEGNPDKRFENIKDAVFMPDGKYLITIDDSNTVTLWLTAQKE